MTIKIKIAFASVSLFFSVILVDFICFDTLLFYFPNELEWDTSPWYNFLHKTKHIGFRENEQGVLIAGSSVALYSALPEKIQETLQKNVGNKIAVDFYSHVAMSPTDFYYYIEDVIAKKPKLVLYLLNPADLQLDHFRELEGRLTYSEKARLEEYKARMPVRAVYPYLFLKDNFRDISKNDIFLLLTKSILRVNRYRSFFYDPINSYLDGHFRKGRSYHNYTGTFPDNGIWSKGFTTQKFHIQCSLKNGKLSDSIFIPQPNWSVSISGEENFSRVFRFEKSGWHNLNLDFGQGRKTIRLAFASDKTVSSKEIDAKQYGTEYFYGIRLSQNFCKTEIERNISYVRRDYLDEHRFDSMSIAEYGKDYFERLYSNPEQRFETHRLRVVKERKVRLSQSEFSTWSEIEYLKKAANILKEKNIRFVIVNNPENPRELAHYGQSKWYRNFLSYLSGTVVADPARFYDLREYIAEERKFMDPHHLVFEGAMLMTPKYAEIIMENLK